MDRLDLELATKAATDFADLDAQALICRMPRAWLITRVERERWIVGVLGLRGFKIDTKMVRTILEGGTDPRCSRQERVFIRGLDRALDRILARGRNGMLPDGWFTVKLFDTVTQGLPRFANNHIRRDSPWDALRNLAYPKPDQVGGLLDRFSPQHRFRDVPMVYDDTHPVRRGFRALWRFARISPFPDFNLLFAFVFMNAYHLASGYPLIAPTPSDKTLLENLVVGPVPRRIVQFESRLLETVG